MLIYAAKQPQENVNYLLQNINFITMIEIIQSNGEPLHLLFFPFLLPESQRLNSIADREMAKPQDQVYPFQIYLGGA